MAGRWKPGVTAQERRDQALLADVAKAANDAIAAAKAKADADAKLATIKKRQKDLISAQNNLKNAGTAIDNAIADSQAALINFCKSYNPALKPYGSATPTTGQAKTMLAWTNEIAANTKLKATNAAQYKTAADQLAAIQSDIYKLTHLSTSHVSSSVAQHQSQSNGNNGGGSSNSSGIVPPPQPSADELVYKYNIPMLRSAYMNPFGPQGNAVTDKKVLSSPTFQNARAAWKNATPSRGSIQMSKVFAASANIMQPKKTKGLKRSEQPYGFRFLYNPTDISMAWGIVDAFSPEYAQSDSNGMTGVAVGLMKGTISFSLLLNRIDDMNILLDDGSYAADTYASDIGNNAYDPYAYTQVRYPAVGTQVVPVLPNAEKLRSPYPMSGEPSFEERAMIYKRGTMYDMEYLFRAMGGYYAQYESGLNGLTADRGWLQPIPMELHLGDGLRYLVRVSSLDIKHIMFNERMVPTLTTVNMVCTRYYDSPDAFDTTYYAPESSNPTDTIKAVK